MNPNDRVLSDSVSSVYQTARKIQQLFRDGKIRELELALGAIHDASSKGVYRCTAIAFADSKLPEGYK